MPIKNQTYQSIIDYCNIISSNPGNASCIEYLFNILKQIGLISMSQGKIDEKLLNRVKKLFSYNTLQASDTHAPSFINFDDLNQEADRFISISIKPHPRVPMHNTEAILWEEKWESVIELGTRLIENGLMIKAVSQGEDLLCLSDCKAGEKVSNAWSQSWQKFKEKSVSFINKLITKGNIEKFFILSDDVVSLLAEYAFIPEDNFQKFLYNISAPKENYAENHNYRKLVTANEAKELFEQVKKKYQNDLNVSLAYTFEAAMAQKAIKNFILNNCSLLESAGYSSYGKFLTNLDIDTGSETPFIIAGNKLFTNHIIISDVFLAGWGVRKDDDAIKSLNQPETDFSGALFCSLKQYPNGAWTISFDSYKNKEQFYKLIEQGDEYFVRLPYEQIFDEDKRDEFLQEAAEAVVKFENVVVVKQSESDQIANTAAESSVDLSELEQRLIAANAAVSLIRIIMTAIKITKQQHAFRVYKPSPSYMGDAAKPPEYNIIFVPSDFPDKGGMFDFLDPNSDQENVRQLRFYGLEQDWQFVPFFVDAKGEIVGKPNNPEEIDELDPIELNLPAETKVVLIAVGPSEELIKVKNAFEMKAPIDNTKSKICWVIYGHEKETSANQE